MDKRHPPRTNAADATPEPHEHRTGIGPKGALLLRIFALLPLAALAWAGVRTVGRTDPETPLFRAWLSADPAANPIPFHRPFRTKTNALLYLSARHVVPVKAAMSGSVLRLTEGGLELSGENSLKQRVVLSYHGVTAIRVKPTQLVKCGDTIGLLERAGVGAAVLQVSATVSRATIELPLEFPPLGNGSEHQGHSPQAQ